MRAFIFNSLSKELSTYREDFTYLKSKYGKWEKKRIEIYYTKVQISYDGCNHFVYQILPI